MKILRQKEFARKDYEGLNEEEKKILKKNRSEYAKNLKKSYRQTMEDINKLPNNNKVITSKLKFGGGGVSSNVNQRTASGVFDTKPIKELHKNGIRDTIINKTLPEVKQLLRGESVIEAKQIADSGNRKGKEAAAKRDIQVRQETSNLRNEFRDRVKKFKEEKAEARRKASEESIAKHEAKAAGLRAKKEAAEKLKGNLKKGGIGTLAIGGTVAAGYGAKKLYDKKKSKESEKN